MKYSRSWSDSYGSDPKITRYDRPGTLFVSLLGCVFFLYVVVVVVAGVVVATAGRLLAPTLDPATRLCLGQFGTLDRTMMDIPPLVCVLQVKSTAV